MPRYPLRGEPADQVVAFRLTRTEKAFVLRVADANGMSVGQLLASAVNEFAADLSESGALSASLTVCIARRDAEN